MTRATTVLCFIIFSVITLCAKDSVTLTKGNLQPLQNRNSTVCTNFDFSNVKGVDGMDFDAYLDSIDISRDAFRNIVEKGFDSYFNKWQDENPGSTIIRNCADADYEIDIRVTEFVIAPAWSDDYNRLSGTGVVTDRATGSTIAVLTITDHYGTRMGIPLNGQKTIGTLFNDLAEEICKRIKKAIRHTENSQTNIKF